MDKERLGAVLVALSAVCFAFMPVFTKLAYISEVNMITALAGRFALASLIIWIYIFLSGQSAVVGRKELKSFFVLGFWGYIVASTSLFGAILYIPASLASMLLYIHPVLVALAETLIHRLPLTINKATALVLSTLGLIFILGVTSKSVSVVGVLLGICSALGYTVYLLHGRRTAQGSNPIITTGYILLMAAVIFNGYGFITGGLNFNFEPRGWLWIGGMSLVSTCMAVLFLFAGLRFIEAGRVAIISTFEPALTVGLAAIILSERINHLQVAGGVMVLTAIIILQQKKLGFKTLGQRGENPGRNVGNGQSEE